MSITNGSATALAIRYEPSTTPVITAALLTTYPLARREVGQNIANVDGAGIWPHQGSPRFPTGSTLDGLVPPDCCPSIKAHAPRHYADGRVAALPRAAVGYGRA